MQASGARGVDLLAALRGGRLRVRALDLVAVPVAASDPLVAAGAEGVSTVARRRAVARQDHGRDRGGLARVVERAVQLVDRAGTEGVADVGAVKGDAHDRHVGALGAAVRLGAARNAAVVGDVGEVETLDLAPARRIEGVGDEGECTHASDSNRRGGGGLPCACVREASPSVSGSMMRRAAVRVRAGGRSTGPAEGVARPSDAVGVCNLTNRNKGHPRVRGW